jgi:hypothetical protein
MTASSSINIRLASAIFFFCALNIATHAQNSSIKPGLWETQTSTHHVMSLPPEAEARIAALPAAQQAQVRAMMGGGAGAAPMVVTVKTCIAPGSTLDNMLDRSQQNSAMSCSFTNRTQTATGASFDMECTGKTASAKGHTDIHTVDADHVTTTTHLTMTGTAPGHPMNATMDTTGTAHFISPDCGDVKPYTPPPAK